MSRNIPNLFLIGAPKSGTTALVNCLTQHPHVYCKEKEPRFFDAHTFYDYREDYPFKGLDEYLELFSGKESANAKYRLDASVFNMYSGDSIREILKVNNKAKFIIVLRDPLEATKSMFKQRLKYVSPTMREISNNFEYCWSLIKKRREGKGYPKGCKTSFIFQYDRLYHYEWYVPEVIKLVGRNNILILRYEDYKEYPYVLLRKVFSWLDIPYSALSIKNENVNLSKTVSDSFINKVLYFISSNTLSVRKVVGLTGNNAMWLKKIFYYFQTKGNEIISEQCDEDIISEFSETYDYLKMLDDDRMSYRVNKN